MKFDNTKDVKQVLEQMYDLVMSVATEENKLLEELKFKEDIQQDLLHEIELAPLNAIELVRIAIKLKKVRKERRKVKDTLEFIKVIKNYTRRFIKIGILSETSQIMKNIDTYNEKLKNRQYIPRVLKDLKCVKKDNKGGN